MINSDDIKKIFQLSDEELNEKISIVMKATGNNSSDEISKDTLDKIKKTVLSMSEKDISNVLSNLPAEKLSEIFNNVKNDT